MRTIKELRQELNLTQKEFGLIFGYIHSQIRISELETGKLPISNQMVRFLDFLNFLIDMEQKDLILMFYKKLKLFYPDKLI